MGHKGERTELLNSIKMNTSVDESDVAVPEVEKNVISSTFKAVQASSTQGTPDDIQRQILEQLQRVNQRLDGVKDRMGTGTQHCMGNQGETSGKKLSSTFHRTVKKSMLSNSESSEDESISSLVSPS